MGQYMLRRLLLVVPTLFGVTAIIFVLLRVIPGDPVDALFGQEDIFVRDLTEKELEDARHSLGLDRPLVVQYVDWMGEVLKGDLGTSFWRDTKIRDVILRRAPITIEIAVIAVVMAWAIGLPVGIVSAARRNTRLDYVSRLSVTFLMAVPNFWLGLTTVMVVILLFNWRPPLTIYYLWDDPLKNLQITLGPAVAFALGFGATIARMTRATLLEVLNDDYIRTARAKGLASRLIMRRHALRNAILPVVTLTGLQLAGIMGGSVAVEKAFSVPGLGSQLVDAIGQQDYWMIQNLVLLYGVIYVFVNLAVDLAYAWIDPRIRYN